ncbi:uncharacterized protein LOC133985279 [Scomber scombrus]|uniref:uncharacterized protein LOC133985279 n=1 Tax=Scomber scombrus TaxID=13677 RepID=UPI002DDAB474|nr:uncharacterized protein LOC133985279 [Scomber scombrus]
MLYSLCSNITSCSGHSISTAQEWINPVEEQRTHPFTALIHKKSESRAEIREYKLPECERKNSSVSAGNLRKQRCNQVRGHNFLIMMKLILSLTLIWTLSSTVTVHGHLHQTTGRSCVTPPPNIQGKHTFSYDLGFETMVASLHMCNTDGCNNHTIPYPDVQKKNNLQCFICDDRSSAECKKKTLQCEGNEDRCFSGTVEFNDGEKVHTFGCVSGYLCEHFSDLKLLPDNSKFIHPPKCCKGSFCNSAWSVKLNVMTLLFGLTTLIFY